MAGFGSALSSGQERESTELDEDKPVADQIQPPTGGSAKQA
jgi:hypothetical protein